MEGGCTRLKEPRATDKVFSSRRNYNSRLMSYHTERLRLMADALNVPVDQVVTVLRRKSEQYYDASGVLVFDSSWPDELMVAAAVRVFVTDPTTYDRDLAATTD